jgi:predicted nucleic acid-binding protein
VTYLLDTCTLSQGAKPGGDKGLLAWLAATPLQEQFVSVLSFAEIEFGILRTPAGQRRENLGHWFEYALKRNFAGRILPFDMPSASIWATLRARHMNAGLIDSQIAATALAKNLTLVTRNVRDFQFEGLNVFNPWSK